MFWAFYSVLRLLGTPKIKDSVLRIRMIFWQDPDPTFQNIRIRILT
jgi:hypothetical protein